MKYPVFLAALLVACTAWTQADLQSPPEVVFSSFITGLNDPVRLVPAPDGRLFILEQPQGDVEVYQPDGTYIGTFLNVSGLISTGSERGLLGMAFHPDYTANGKFYLNYTDGVGDTVVSEWSVSSNQNVADPASEVVLLNIVQDFSNHNGGHIAFGPDGHLYIGTGDGGSGGDPLARAQDGQSLLGKMLRIAVAGDGTYTIPVDNPFLGAPGVLDEIWAIGMRNPWNFSFDPLTGDLWNGDVGQDQFEEISVQSGASTGGENYGWRCWEGLVTFNTSECSTLPHHPPVITHAHTGFTGWCSITGGFVYRGTEYPGMEGYYLYTDYCLGEIHALKDDGAGDYNAYTVNSDGNFGYVHLATGTDGTAYIVDIGGQVLKVEDACNTLPEISLEVASTLEVNIAGATTYTWYQDGSALAGSDAETWTPTTSGTYSCLVDVDGCVRLSNAQEVAVQVGVPGCTYANASNYEANASVDDGSCLFSDSCDADLNGDGTIGTADILDILGAFGTDCP